LPIVLLVLVSFAVPYPPLLTALAMLFTIVLYIALGVGAMIDRQLSRIYCVRYVPEARRKVLWGYLTLAWGLAISALPIRVFLLTERPGLQRFFHHIYAEEPADAHPGGQVRNCVLTFSYEKSVQGVYFSAGPFIDGFYTEDVDGGNPTLRFDVHPMCVRRDISFDLTLGLWPELRR
jgi:hypothetical protein